MSDDGLVTAAAAALTSLVSASSAPHRLQIHILQKKKSQQSAALESVAFPVLLLAWADKRVAAPLGSAAALD